MGNREKVFIGCAVLSVMVVAGSLVAFNLGYYHALRGGLVQDSNVDEAIEFFLVAYEKNPDGFMVTHDLAGCYALKGDADECFVWLERALNGPHGSYARDWAQGESDFDSVRESTRFQELVYDR